MHVGEWMAGSHINCISLFGRARGTVDGGHAAKDMAERGLNPIRSVGSASWAYRRGLV